MTYTVNSRWDSPATHDADWTYKRLIAMGAKEPSPGFLRDVIDTFYEVGPKVNLNPDLMTAHCANEAGKEGTGVPFQSVIYLTRGVIDGLGVTDGGDQGLAFDSGVDAARAHMVHLYGYVHGAIPTNNQLYAYRYLDPRYQLVLDSGNAGKVVTVAGMTGKWWTDPNGHNAVIQKTDAIFDTFTSPVDHPPQDQEGNPLPTKPTIFITAGHRSDNDSGNPNEKERTDDMARAYRDAFTTAGFAVHYVQNEDGDNRPDITTGGLDTVGQKTRALMLSVAGPEVLFDCHFEGSSARGVFAIVPDEAGLTTAVAGGAPGNDTWANNPLDVALARSIAKKISNATGLPLRSTTEPGVMSERATGVGGQGYRLAMMAYTVPVRDRAVRLVVEHGSLPVAADLAIINAPGFYTTCAGAAVAAVMEVYELGAVIVDPPVPTTSPPPKPTGPQYPKGMTRQIAEQRFGKLEYTDADGTKRIAQFDENGPVSRAWLANIAKQLQPGESYRSANIGPIVTRTPRGTDKRYVDYGFAGMPTIMLDTETGKAV